MNNECINKVYVTTENIQLKILMYDVVKIISDKLKKRFPFDSFNNINNECINKVDDTTENIQLKILIYDIVKIIYDNS
jgi:hypothetical protein